MHAAEEHGRILVKLVEENRVRDVDEYNISTCTLHAINLNLSSTTELAMGCGGLKERTFLQCLHLAYNLLQACRKWEWCTIWTLINTKGCRQLISPVLSLWECVGEACEHVIKHYKQWKKFFSHVISEETVTQHDKLSHLTLFRSFASPWLSPTYVYYFLSSTAGGDLTSSGRITSTPSQGGMDSCPTISLLDTFCNTEIFKILRKTGKLTKNSVNSFRLSQKMISTRHKI